MISIVDLIVPCFKMEMGAGEINSYVMFQWLKDFEQNPPGPRDPIYLGDMLELFRTI